MLLVKTEERHMRKGGKADAEHSKQQDMRNSMPDCRRPRASWQSRLQLPSALVRRLRAREQRLCSGSL